MVLDLSLLDSVKKFATAFLELDIPLHILINNAGVMGCPKSETQDGLELQFGVNHIGHFYLTTLLLDKIKSSSPSRIVNLSSNGHYLHCPEEGIVFDDLSGTKHYDAWQRYGQSKLANILFTKELQNRLDTEGADVTVTALHPGAINTNLARHLSISTAFKLLLNPKVYRHIFSFKNVQQGVATTIFCALDPRVIKGGYYSDCNIEREEVNPHVHDSELAKKLWVVSEELVQSK
ncbi:hypothetical protein K7432_013057 [Basidiobolus ranarum]|uniref:Uncharacterized protein n=1 Tax=Basidiobolus ranarum TaxID=34480 RepID=A0ABR2VSA1_9FUNG